LYEENRSFDVTVRYPLEYRNSLESISNTLMAAPHCYNVPLSHWQISQSLMDLCR
jgi:cobalt-zinc-cadmium resistance protein CzcA